MESLTVDQNLPSCEQLMVGKGGLPPPPIPSRFSKIPEEQRCGFLKIANSTTESELTVNQVHFSMHSPQETFAVGRNCGARRAFVACSNAYANLISVGSL